MLVGVNPELEKKRLKNGTYEAFMCEAQK